MRGYMLLSELGAAWSLPLLSMPPKAGRPACCLQWLPLGECVLVQVCVSGCVTCRVSVALELFLGLCKPF